MNPFDQFDNKKQNPFDTFDNTPVAPVAGVENPFDKFDSGFKPVQNFDPLGTETQLPKAEDLPLSEYLKTSYDRPLTKEDILNDQKLMGRVRENLRTRFGDRSLIAGGLTSALGGATSSYTDDMSDEEVFEMWQNYHRSFAGGQSVTTANELAYVNKADEATKAKLSEGYELFDSMGNIFTGDGTWSETFDGLRDYMQAAIWDPTTVASFGVGRLFTAGGSRAAAEGIRQAAKVAAKETARQALAKGVPLQVAQQAGREAANIAAKKAFLKVGAQKTVQFGGFDAVASVAADAGYQAVKMDVNLQENWNYGQTGLAALGVFVLPAMVAGGKVTAQGVRSAVDSSPTLKKLFENYDGVVKATAGKTAKQIEDAVKKRVDLTQVNTALKTSFENFSKNKDKMMSWDAAKAASRELLEEEAVDPTLLSPTNKFFDTFLFGGPLQEGAPQGLVLEAANAGFVYVPRTKDDKVTNWIGDLISWLDQDVVEAALKSFDDINNTNVYDDIMGLNKGSLSDNLSAAWKLSGSEAGYRLLLSRKGADLLSSKGNFAKALLDEASKKTKKEVPAPAHYVQSVWKRLLTAHPGTTGANIQGWGAMSLANTVSDFALGVVNYGQAGASILTGNRAQAKNFLTMGNGAILSSVRRGFNLLDPMDTLSEADAFFKANPEIAKDIFRELAGDVGATDAPTRFNMNTSSPTIKGVEAVVQSAQKISGVVLQDEITKQLSFMANLDRALLRSYGKSYTDFMRTADSLVEMKTTKFAEAVAQATDRTLRETASKSWSDTSEKWFTRSIASSIESVSNNAIGGYAVPFGRFFNTSIAFFGDFTMLNFLNHGLKRTFNKEAIDPLTEEGAELFAKGVVGLSALYLMSESAMEKIDQGLSWNQEPNDDGSIRDETYNFPESYMRGVAQLIGHYRKDGEVPRELQAEVGMLIVGQTFRAGQEGIQAATNLYFDATSGDLALGFESASDILTAFTTNLVSGATRPLDPLNQFAAMLSEEGGVPDRRQGIEMLRYVDQIPSALGLKSEVPLRATPTRGTDLPTDMGRVLGGVRESQEPNPVERMFNSVGTAAWREVRWDGDPAVKNRMDQIIDPILNVHAMAMLEKNPDFFEMPLSQRQAAVDMVVKAAVAEAKKVIKVGSGNDAVLNLMYQIETSSSKADLRKAKEFLGIEESLEELSELPGAKEKLETLLYIVKNMDRFIELGIK